MDKTITLREFYMKDNDWFLQDRDDYESFIVELEGDTSMKAGVSHKEKHLWVNNGNTSVPHQFAKSYVHLYTMCKSAMKGTKFCMKCGKIIRENYISHFAAYFHPDCLTQSEKEMIDWDYRHLD